MQQRENALNQWLCQIDPNNHFAVAPLAGDASFRRYWRAHQNTQSYVVMDAPPEKESLTPFIHTAKIFNQLGIKVPQIMAVEPTLGFMLLEDFGDDLFFKSVTGSPSVEEYYLAAINILHQLQKHTPKNIDLPEFNQAHMQQELDYFLMWFLDAYLNRTLSPQEKIMLQDACHYIVEAIDQQPKVIIHRDFHSRNLLVLHRYPPTLGVIDFQDAMMGPLAYDLVSLLKDCYLTWPKAQIDAWVLYFYKNSTQAQQQSLEAFKHDFELCGIQRHLKVLGIFCRLHLRDGKSDYLQHLPLIVEYLMQSMQQIPALKPMLNFMNTVTLS